MAGHVQHVVHPAEQPVVALVVAPGAVAGEVAAREPAPVLLLIPLRVAPDRARHGWPGPLQHQVAALGQGHAVALVVEHVSLDAGEWEGCGARLECGDSRQWRDQDLAGFSHPPGVDDRAAIGADYLAVPDPRLGIDRFTDSAEHAQARQIMLGRVVLAPLHERADSRWGGVDDRDAVLLDERPESILVREIGRALVHYARSPVGH